MITVTVRAVSEGSYRPQQLMIELGLGKTQFARWVKALGLYKDGGRKHFYSLEDRNHLLLFRMLLNKHKSLNTAYDEWFKQTQA